MRVFVLAVESGSLTAAARRVGLPKSSVSRRLLRLEETLGTRLLRRTAAGIELTDAGRVAFEPAKSILDDSASLIELVRETHATPRGQLRVSAAADLAGMDWWMNFAKDYPEVRLQVEFSNRYVDLVREGFDVALRGGRGEDESLIARRVGCYRLRAVASRQWIREHGAFTTGDPLFARGAVVLSPPKSARGARASRIIVANDNRTALDGALKGLGVAVLADHICSKAIEDGALRTLHPDYDPLEVPLYAVYPDRAYMPATLTAFLNAAAQVFREE